MITLKLKPWVPIAGLEHMKSSWQVATDAEFTNILDDVIESDEYLNIYYSSVVIPEGTTYYIRARRHYNNDTSSDWSAAIPVVPKVDDSNLLITNDVIIDKPMVYLDLDVIKDDDTDSFIIETSVFRSTTEGHFGTTWIIKDGSGKILFISLSDEVNLTSIIVPKSDVNIENVSLINVYAVHMTASGISSEVGIKTLILSEDVYNYEINNNDLQRAIPNADYTLSLNKIDLTLPYGVTSITVTNAFDIESTLYHKDISIEDSTIIIPGDVLQPDISYIVALAGYNIDGQHIRNIIMKTTINSELTNIDLNYVYENELNFLYDTNENIFASSYISHEWHNNQIPIPMKDGTIHKYGFDRDTNRLIDLGIMNELQISNSDVDDVYIRLLENNRLVVDRISDGGFPTFDVYAMNPSTDEITFIHSILRTDETHTLGKTGGIVHIDDTEALYLVVGGSIIRKVNLSTKIITDIATVPLDNIGLGTMIDLAIDKVMVIGAGSDGESKLYDVDDDQFADGPRIPLGFRNHTLQAVRLINNYTAIFRTDFIEGEDNDFMIYNVDDGTLDTVSVDSYNNEFTNTSILLRTGGVLRNLVDPDTNTTYIYELV